MIREPYGVFPYNNTIDTSVSQPFSFYFSGDRLASCAFQIYDASSFETASIYDSKIYEQPKIFSDNLVTSMIPALSGNANRDLTWRRRLVEYNANKYLGYGKIATIGTDKKQITYKGQIKVQTADVYYLVINGSAYRLRSVDFTRNTITLLEANTNIEINDTFTIMGETLVDAATNLMGTGRIRQKPEDEPGKIFTPIDDTHLYIEPTTALRLGVSLPSYEGITFMFGSKTSNITAYDYTSSLLTLASPITTTVGEEYFVKNNRGIAFITGRVQPKPDDIKPVIYPPTTTNSFYIGQHPKLKTIKFGSNPINERSVVAFEYEGKRHIVQNYDFDNGFITLKDNLSPKLGTNYSVFANFLDTNYYFFQSREVPTVAIMNFMEEDNLIVKSRKILFEGLYHRTSGESIKYHQWQIMQNDKEVDKTEKLYNSDLLFEFNEGLNNTTYQITLTIVTQNDVTISATNTFTMKYDEYLLGLRPKAKVLTNRNGIAVDWSTIIFSNPTISNPPPKINDNIFNSIPQMSGAVLKPGNFIEYNSLSDDDLIINTKQFYLSFLFSIQTNSTNRLLLLKNKKGDQTFEMIQDHSRILFKRNGQSIGLAKLLTEVFGVTPYLAKETEAYLWVEGSDKRWNDDYYWSETIADLSKNPYRLVLTSEFIELYKYVNNQPQKVFSLSHDWQGAIYNSIRFEGEMNISTIILTEDKLTTEQQNKFKQFDYVPTWDELELGQLIVSFKNDSFSSSSGDYITEQVRGYLLYRCDVDENDNITAEKYIGSIQADPVIDRTFFIDDSATNKKRYLYKIYPITSYSVAGSIQTNIVEPDWEFWTFYEVKLNEKDKRYEVIGNPWNLKLNVASEGLTLNTTRTIHTNLSKYPKATIGPQKYFTQSFSALLGNFNLSTEATLVNGDWLSGREYLDNVDKINQWIDFSMTNNPILVQSPKGIKYLAAISNSTFNINEQTVELLTTVSFTLTQIGDLDTYQVVTVEENFHDKLQHNK